MCSNADCTRGALNEGQRLMAACEHTDFGGENKNTPITPKQKINGDLLFLLTVNKF